jgi:Ca2+-binding EF-hand superfamily protein
MNRIFLGLSAAAIAILPVTARADDDSQEKKAPTRWESLKQRFDLDKDGRITWEEYRKVQSGFASLDQDADGVITEKDAAEFPATPGLEQIQALLKQFGTQGAPGGSPGFSGQGGPLPFGGQVVGSGGQMPGFGGQMPLPVGGPMPFMGGGVPFAGCGMPMGMQQPLVFGPFFLGGHGVPGSLPGVMPGRIPGLQGMPQIPGLPGIGGPGGVVHLGPIGTPKDAAGTPSAKAPDLGVLLSGGAPTMLGGIAGNVALLIASRTADADKDGTLSAKEWSAWLKSLEANEKGVIAAEKLTGLFPPEAGALASMMAKSMFDHDRDGTVELADFEAAFKAADKDGDGAIVLKDLMPAGGAMGFPMGK